MKECSKCKTSKKDSDFPFKSKTDRRLRSRCKSCHATENKNYRSNNPERCAEIHQQWLDDNAEHMRQYYKDYAAANREHKNLYYVTRRETDLQFRLAYLLRGRLYVAMKGKAKAGSAVRDLGCTLDELKQHLEKLMQPGMTWENYGRNDNQWSIDHIIPLSHFDLTDPEQIKIVCHYSNLQPMWAPENIRKGARLDYSPTSVSQLK